MGLTFSFLWYGWGGEVEAADGVRVSTITKSVENVEGGELRFVRLYGPNMSKHKQKHKHKQNIGNPQAKSPKTPSIRPTTEIY